MLAVPADRLPAALADLDPGNRALLDLSLRRGVSDSEIGELLRKEPDEVARGRDAVLGLLADALGLDGQDRRERVRRAVAELPEEAWTSTRSASAEEAPAAAGDSLREDFEEPEPDRDPRHEDFDEPAPAPAPDTDRAPGHGHDPIASVRGESISRTEREPRAERELRGEREPGVGEDVFLPPSREPRRRTGLVLALLGVLIVGGVLAALLLGGSDDDGGNADPAPPPPDRQEPAPPRQDAGKSVRLRALGADEGGGRLAAVGDGRFAITLTGLPRPEGVYQAWLYNNVVDAIPLGTFREGSGRLAVRLPATADRYRFLDVSLEPADSNRNHSGDSVLRARLKPLLAR